MGNPKREIQARLDFALELAAEGGDISRRFFRHSGLAVEMKGNGTPVSEADKRIEDHFRKKIRQAFPGEGIIGEEHGPENVGQINWILDPIDGTESFIRGVPLYGNLIGVEMDGEVVAGVANLPALEELFYAGTGLGAWWRKRETGDEAQSIRVSQTSNLAGAMSVFSGANYFRMANRMRLFEELNRRSGMTRGWGDCLGHLLVASGRADVALDPVMEIWDSAALLPIVREAGGIFTDFSGQPNIRGKTAISTNGLFHGELLQMAQTVLD